MGLDGLAAALAGNEIAKSDTYQGVKIWLDTGYPPLNKAISGRFDGGMPVGRIVEMYGPESSGKTAIATEVMKAAQKMGGLAIFNDHERSFMPDLAKANGLNVDEPALILKYPETFEASVTNTIKLLQMIRDSKQLPPEAPIVVVFDSLASMVPQSKFAKDVDEQGMNDSLALAKACSAVFPTLSIYAEKLNALMLFLNQEREKPGVVYGDPTTTPGGKAPKFYASIRIQIGRKKIVEGSSKEFIGQIITSRCVKNKVARPFLESQWRFMFREDGTGYFDVVGSLLDYLIETGVIQTAGPRVKWTDGKSYFKKQLVDQLNEDPEASKSLLVGMIPNTVLPLPAGEEDDKVA